MVHNVETVCEYECVYACASSIVYIYAPTLQCAPLFSALLSLPRYFLNDCILTVSGKTKSEFGKSRDNHFPLDRSNSTVLCSMCTYVCICMNAWIFARPNPTLPALITSQTQTETLYQLYTALAGWKMELEKKGERDENGMTETHVRAKFCASNFQWLPTFHLVNSKSIVEMQTSKTNIYSRFIIYI